MPIVICKLQELVSMRRPARARITMSVISSYRNNLLVNKNSLPMQSHKTVSIYGSQ